MFKNFNEYKNKKVSAWKVWLSVCGVTAVSLIAETFFIILVVMMKFALGSITSENFEQALSDMSLNLFATVMVVITIMVATLLIQKQKKESIGVEIAPKSVYQYLIGIVIGFIMFSMCLVPAYITGTLTTTTHYIESNTYVLLFIYAIGYMIQSFSEELLCRGYILTQYSKRYNIWISLFLQALIFAALHLANNGLTILAFVNIMLFGLIFGFLTILTNNIVLASAIHFIWNYAQGCIYGLSVSGINQTSSFLESQIITMNSMWTGGAFGIEASVSVTIVEAIIIIVCLPKAIKIIKQKNSTNSAN